MVEVGEHDVRAIVQSVDKNAYTCTVQVVSTDGLLVDVKLKPVVNSGDASAMGLVVFPALNSFVTVGKINGDNNDTMITGYTQIDSISLDTATALKLMLANDGNMNLNVTKLVFNDGKNGGIPMVNPLSTAIMKLQQQVNQLITAFKTHVHPVSGAATGPTLTPSPGLTIPVIKPSDIANPNIQQ